MAAADTNPSDRRVEGIIGETTDSSALFRVDQGDSYKQFWTNVSARRADANFAVVGTTFDEDPTDESLIIHGEPEVQVIADRLRTTAISRVLEVGVGVGRLAHHMARRCGEFVGCDVSPNMIATARENCRGLDNVDFVEIDGTSPLPFEDESFDAVYAQAVFIHLDREDCYRYMREARRVLRPGGRAWFQFYNLIHPEGFRIFDWVATNAVKPDGKVRGRVQFATAAEVRAYAGAAGFVIDEGASLLENERQRFVEPVPTLNWEYYLVVVGETPAVAGRAPAALADSRAPRPPIVFSDEYCVRYRDAFFRKAQHMHLDSVLRACRDYLLGLPPWIAFRCVHAIEVAVERAQRIDVNPLELLPVLLQAGDQVERIDTLPARFADGLDRFFSTREP